MFLNTLSLILIISIINVYARPQQALHFEDQNGALANQAIAQLGVSGVPTTSQPAREFIVKIPGSPEASAAASAIAGHPVKVVKVIKKISSPSVGDRIPSPTQPSVAIDIPAAAGIATQPPTPDQLGSTTTIGAVAPAAPTTATATITTPELTATVGGNAFEVATNAIVNTTNAISAAISSNRDPSANSGAVTDITLGATTNYPAANPAVGVSNVAPVGPSAGTDAFSLASTVHRDASAVVTPAAGVGSVLVTSSPVSSVASAATTLSNAASASSASVAANPAGAVSAREATTTVGPLTTNSPSTSTPDSQDGESRGALSALFGKDKKAKTTKPRAAGFAGFLDGFKKKFFGDGDKGKGEQKDEEEDKKEEDKKDEKNKKRKKKKDKDKDNSGEKDDDEGGDGDSRGGDTMPNLARILAKQLLDQAVHLAINSAGSFLNTTAHKAATIKNAGIERSAMLATKLNNLEAELPAKAFEKLSQIDCNMHEETLAAICQKTEGKKKDNKKEDSKKDNKKKGDKREDKKDKRKKEGEKYLSRNQLPELDLEKTNGGRSKSGAGPDASDQTTKKPEQKDDLIATTDEIQRVNAEKKLEVENPKAKLDSEIRNPQKNKETNSRLSVAIATPGHQDVAVSSPEKSDKSIGTVTSKKPDAKESTTSITKKPDERMSTTTGKQSNHIQIAGLIKPADTMVTKVNERAGINDGPPPPRVQTLQTTTTAVRPPNLLESFSNVIKSIVPGAIPNYKTLETETVNGAGG